MLHTYGYLHLRKTLVVDRPLSRTEKARGFDGTRPTASRHTLRPNNLRNHLNKSTIQSIATALHACSSIDSQQGLLVVVAEFPPQHGSRFLMVRMLPYRSHGSPPVPFLGRNQQQFAIGRPSIGIFFNGIPFRVLSPSACGVTSRAKDEVGGVR
jgi:hypothetical protein